MTRPPLVDLYPPYKRLDKLICIRSLKKRVLTPPAISVGILNMTIAIVLERVILSLKMFDKIQCHKENLGNNAQIVARFYPYHLHA